jgi:hypothetical protein
MRSAKLCCQTKLRGIEAIVNLKDWQNRQMKWAACFISAKNELTKVISLVVVFGVFFAVAEARVEAQQSQPVTLGTAHEQHEIYGSSATASAEISFDTPNYPVGANIFIHVKLESHVGREIEINPDGIKFDVRDSNGKRPAETEVGCLAHFFSNCYTGWLYRRKIVQLPFKSFDKLEWDKNISKEYDLKKPGAYSVVAYVCGIGHLTDCFRTNVVKFSVK